MRKHTAFELFSDPQIRAIRRRMVVWGRENFTLYPWRVETDPWLTFLSEFFLQRTRASQVEEFFNEFKARYPSARSFVEGGTEAVSFVTNRLGLHWRGPLLAAIAEDVFKRGGTPPENHEDLMQYTGVGMYTASAWLSLHRGKRAAIIDANVVRWLSRMTGMPYNRDPRGLKWAQNLCQRLTPERIFRDYNYAVLDFTMNLCVIKDPQCSKCPFPRYCRFGKLSLSKCYDVREDSD